MCVHSEASATDFDLFRPVYDIFVVVVVVVVVVYGGVKSIKAVPSCQASRHIGLYNWAASKFGFQAYCVC
jgi:hypothetical protein